VNGHNYLTPLIFGAGAAVCLFNWAIMPRWGTAKNVGARHRRLRSLWNVDRSFSLLGFVFFAAVALISLFIGDGAAG